MNRIELTARLTDFGFVFVPEKWKQEIKPYRNGCWTHSIGYNKEPYNYTLKEGIALVFPDQHHGVIHASRLFAVVSEMGVAQAMGTYTPDGIVFEKTTTDGLRFRILLKFVSMNPEDDLRRVEFKS